MSTPAQGAPIAVVEDLVFDYGGVRALDGVDLRVERGEVVGLIGPNGAGKTTLLNCLGATPRPSSTRMSGGITVAGRDVTVMSAHSVVALGVGRSFQRTALVAELDVESNLLLGRHRLVSGWVWGPAVGTRRYRREDRRHRDACAAVAERLGLCEYLSIRAGELAFGLRKRVEIARVLASEPVLMLLDEPTAGLSAEEADAVVRLLREVVTTEGVATVLVDHDLRVVAAAADRVVAMDHGRVIAKGTPGEVAMDPAVVESYLGPSQTGPGRSR